MIEYKIPQGIKEKFTKEFLESFLNELRSIFEITSQVSYSNHLSYFESSCGWADAFHYVCEEYELNDVWDYYDKLNWDDADIFDYELARFMVECGLAKE